MQARDLYQEQLLDDLRKGHALRPPRTFTADNITVIDDRSKLRAAARIMQGSLSRAFYVAGSPYGATVEAAARVAKSLNRDLTIVFTQTPDDVFSNLKVRMNRLGANTINSPYDIFNEVSGIAKRLADENGAQYINFTDTIVVDAMADGLRQLTIQTGDIWTAGGLGTLGRAIRQGMGNKMRIMVVDVAGQPSAHFTGAQTVIKCPIPFHERSTANVPFPCNANFERKAWPIMMNYYKNNPIPTDGVYFMNPAFD